MTVQPEAPPAPPAPEPPAPAPAPAVTAPPAPVTPVLPPVPAPPAPAAAQPPAQQQPPSPPADGTDWKAEAERLRTLAGQREAEAAQWKAQSRRQEARSKTNHQELQQRDALLRMVAEKVGVEFDDRPDPEILQQRLAEQTTLARQRAVELAVYSSAAASGVNAPAMLDSRDFMSRTAALDPEAPDFHAQLADLVKEAAGQPRYQFQQQPTAQVQPPAQGQQQASAQQAPAPPQPPVPAPPAPSSGADFSGAPGGNRLWTQADLDHAVANDRDGTVVSKAIADGLLVNLGIGKPKGRNRR